VADRPASIQVHDFSGHPFQAELSRELAGRGLTVEHAFSTQYTSGKGVLEHRPGDPETLTFQAIETPSRFEKYSLVRRLAFERSFAAAWIDQLTRKRPDLVIACNVPLFALHRFSRFARRTGLPYVLWHQDVFSLALSEELDRRLWQVPLLHRPIVRTGSRVVTRLEREIVAGARRVVAIDRAFVRQYEAWDLDTSHVEVIPNWAPVHEIVPQERDNAWAEANLGRKEPLRLLYAGTLGRKHNPLLLVELIDRLRERGIDAELTVISEGEGAALLAEEATKRPAITGFVRLLPFQPAERLSQVLSSGDVLVALLEPGASTFSIPSKVLSYLAAGRPVLGIMPADNPAAIDIEEVGGCVVQPDHDGVSAAAEWLATLSADPARMTELGVRSRELAVERFGIEGIAKRFIEVIDGTTSEVV
jgi:glycosyltransferase involved in cell wall biosynthesis